MRKSAQELRRGERGSVLAVSVFGMMAFLLAVGLCVDVSHFYTVKAELQNAADAAALAGASALNSSPSGITLATERAVEAMNGYELSNKDATVSPSDVKFAVNFGGPYMSAAEAAAVAENIRFVKVDIPDKDVSVLFGGAGVGDNVAKLDGNAIAGMSHAPNVHCDWIPLSVIDYDIPMTPGQTYTVRAAPGNMVSPGNYQILAVAGRGGQDVKYGLAGGVDECAEPGQWYDVDTKPGVSAGPVRHGLNTRFDDYSGGLDYQDYPPDVNIKEPLTWEQYKQGLDPATRNSGNFEPSNAAHGGVPMRRVVLIPIVKLDEYDNGRDRVKFNRFAAFFLQTRVGSGDGGDIQAEYIGERIMFGKGGYKPGGGPVTPELTQPVLYK
ncbi:MAG TPA: pilus assembly protein TadG-related protein [Pyrinomonadaceae bacterium]|nr:pilus assembly protein TadG-related protein [Pyrinomonadaceae bacterium]